MSDIKKMIVVNAEDFGLLEGINNGIKKLLQKGILGGVSLMPTGYAFQEAVSIIKQNPTAEVGVHLSLTIGFPVSPRMKKIDVMNEGGCFKKNLLGFFIRYLFGQIKEGQIKDEFRAQICKVKDAGLVITHLNSNQHIHMLPGIFQIVVNLAREFNISFIRLPTIPLDRRLFFKKGSISKKFGQLAMNFLCTFYRPIMKKYGVKYCRHSMGFLESGHLTEKGIRDILSSLGKGKYELICHPGEEDENVKRVLKHWNFEWEDELELLCSESMGKYIRACGVELTCFTN